MRCCCLQSAASYRHRKLAGPGRKHTDALGSPVATTDTNGALIERTNYEPYGSAINKTVDGIGYTGHVMDGATGLTYMQQRYYDPTVGRFLSVDPVTASSGTGANFNRYWYAGNNPYKFVDPDGRKPKDRGAAYVSDGMEGVSGRESSAHFDRPVIRDYRAWQKQSESPSIEQRLTRERLDNYVEIDDVADVVDKSMEVATPLDKVLGNAGNWAQESGARYIYTRHGWIDLKHLIGAASLPFGEQLGDLYEFKQKLSGSYSAGMTEDLRSNSAGASAQGLSFGTRGIFSLGQSSQLIINGYGPYTQEQARSLLAPKGVGP